MATKLFNVRFEEAELKALDAAAAAKGESKSDLARRVIRAEIAGWMKSEVEVGAGDVAGAPRRDSSSPGADPSPEQAEILRVAAEKGVSLVVARALIQQRRKK